MPQLKTAQIQQDISQIQQSETPKKRNMPIPPESLDLLLKTGVQATGTIVGQRQASGKSAARQERIAACGRKPLFGKAKKAAYNECVSKLGSTKSAPAPIDEYYSPPADSGSNNTMKFIGIGIGVLVVGILGFVLYKKFAK